jgi:hypothetical protein
LTRKSGGLGQAVAGLELDAGGFVVAGFVEVDAAVEVALRGLRRVGAIRVQRRTEIQGDEGEGGSPPLAIARRGSCRSTLNLRVWTG